MTPPTFCELCHTAKPTTHLGAYWACNACCGDRIVFCAEGAHDYGGAVDTQGSAVWSCRRVGCGAILHHQALSTERVEAAPETGYLDC